MSQTPISFIRQGRINSHCENPSTCYHVKGRIYGISCELICHKSQAGSRQAHRDPHAVNEWGHFSVITWLHNWPDPIHSFIYTLIQVHPTTIRLQPSSSDIKRLLKKTYSAAVDQGGVSFRVRPSLASSNSLKMFPQHIHTAIRY